MEYEFTLQFKLDPKDSNHDELVERLGAAGCDDAMVGLGVVGHLGLEFMREAASAEAAILSAIADVKKAIPGAHLVEVGPDFVGLTEVADLLGMSRQNMRKLMVTHASSFPAPLHTGSSSLWHLAPVLQFLKERGQPKVTQTLVEVARTAMRCNITKETALIGQKVDERMYALLA
jgi:predicted DNA-binding transcriptional regulator AlpA